MSPTVHVPVMPDEMLQFLLPGPRQIVVDATVGCGGHALLLWEAMRGQGTLVALDRDPEMIELAKRRFHEKGISSRSVRWMIGSFGDLAEHLAGSGITTYDRVLFDLGLNSVQLTDPARGFSFNADGPLDARYSRREPIPTLAEHLRRIRAKQLEETLREYGDERWARRIARAIVRRRERGPIETTAELAAIVRSAVPPTRGRRRIDAATRTFQALRVLVNAEMDHLARGLEQAITGLRPGGRIVVISFHSGEDRLAKQAFRRHEARRRERAEVRDESQEAREQKGPDLEVLTAKPARPSAEECRSNPRARSARLRAAARIEVRSERQEARL